VSPEGGSSSLSSVFGVAVFLGFLLLASQVMTHLYATSTVTAVAFDGARRASAAGGDCSSEEVRARSALGAWGRTAWIRCERSEAGTTTVRIAGPSPARALTFRVGAGTPPQIDRSATVRTEDIGG
jgi:hypothetical protein